MLSPAGVSNAGWFLPAGIIESFTVLQIAAHLTAIR